MMLGISSIVPNTNIDGNDLHDCVKLNKISARWPDAVCGCQFQPTERRKAIHRLPLMSGPTYSYGNRYIQHPGGLGKHVLFHVDVMAI